MAGCRSDDEMDFIEVVTGEIFEVVLSTLCSFTVGEKFLESAGVFVCIYFCNQ